MAHRGTIYPLALRRDFNLNAFTYRGGLAERYQLQLAGMGNGRASDLANSFWQTNAAVVSTPSEMEWTSEYLTFGSGEYRLTLSVVITTSPSRYNRRITIDELDDGIVVIWRFGTDGVLVNPWQPQAGTIPLLLNPAFFGTAGPSPPPNPQPIIY